MRCLARSPLEGTPRKVFWMNVSKLQLSRITRAPRRGEVRPVVRCRRRSLLGCIRHIVAQHGFTHAFRATTTKSKARLIESQVQVTVVKLRAKEQAFSGFYESAEWQSVVGTHAVLQHECGTFTQRSARKIGRCEKVQMVVKLVSVSL